MICLAFISIRPSVPYSKFHRNKQTIETHAPLVFVGCRMTFRSLIRAAVRVVATPEGPVTAVRGLHDFLVRPSALRTCDCQDPVALGILYWQRPVFDLTCLRITPLFTKEVRVRFATAFSLNFFRNRMPITTKIMRQRWSRHEYYSNRNQKGRIIYSSFQN